MKYLRLAFTLLALTPYALHADGDDSDQNSDEQQKPPTEIPDFSNLDDYIYVPKSTVVVGYRYMGGIKSVFSGSGFMAPPEGIPSDTGQNVSRTYHDGYVGVDTRTVTTENGDGTDVVQSITPDGKTNNWGYDNTSQVTPSGYMQFNTYEAMTDPAAFNASGKSNLGIEVSVAHDVRDYGKRWSLKAFGGFSVNDISAYSQQVVNATLTTITDTYDLYGVTPPSVASGTPYSSTGTGTTTQTLTDSSGNPILDSNGNPETETVDASVLLSSAPIYSTSPGTTSIVQVGTAYKVHGAFATFRGGPEVIYNFTDHLHADLSAGPALVYAGTSFQVVESLTPLTGAPIVDVLNDTTAHVTVGFYVDGTLQYDLTDTTGFYLGAYDQDTGSYNQSTNTPGGLYTAKVDLSGLSGFRAGMAIKF